MNSDNSNSSFQNDADRRRRLQELFDTAYKKQSKTTLKSILIAAATILGIFAVFFVPAFIYLTFAHGFVLAKMWAWFIVPLGVIPIKTLHAAGIVAVVKILTYDINTFSNKSQDDDAGTGHHVAKLVGIVVAPWVALLFAYIIKCFM